MKRTKQTQKIVNAINEYLRNNHIKSQGDPVFVVITHALINANAYQGFNYFTADGKLFSGENENEKFDHLEFY